MTVKELREKLANFSDDIEVRIGVTDITDHYNFLVCGYANVEKVYYDEYYKHVYIEGEDDC